MVAAIGIDRPMPARLSVTEIGVILDSRQARTLGGEPISALAHALQTAWMAQQSRADEALIAAALLHDLGHLLASTDDDLDDHHELTVLPYLGGFPLTVTEPIRLHVDAKRYLCRRDYTETLTTESIRSLNVQGGPMDDTTSRSFLRQPFSAQALALRLWDDRAKVPGLTTPPLAHFLRILERVYLPAAALPDAL
jgi:predicted HD phosphohydrolase